MKEKKEHKIFNLSSISIIVCDCLQSIVSIFFDLFVVANILQYDNKPAYNIMNIGLFYLLEYVTLALMYFGTGYFLKKHNKSIFVSIGSVMLTVTVLVVYLLGNHLYTFLPLVGMIYGVSWGFFSSGFYNLTTETISSKHQVRFFAAKRIAFQLTSVIFPIILGYIVEYINFSILALIMLVLCLALITFSFLIRPKQHYELTFNVKAFVKYLKEHKEEVKPLKKMYVAMLFRGAIYDCIGTFITILVYTSLRSNAMLGTLQSVFTVLSLVTMFLYLKFYRKKRAKGFIIPIITLVPLAIVGIVATAGTNVVFIILFYAFYVTLNVVLTSITDSRRSSVIRTLSLHKNILESTIIMEQYLGVGRCAVTGLLILSGFLDSLMGDNSTLFLLIALAIVGVIYVLYGISVIQMEKSLIEQDKAFTEAHVGEAFEKNED